jgi:hypothetical protein
VFPIVELIKEVHGENSPLDALSFFISSHSKGEFSDGILCFLAYSLGSHTAYENTFVPLKAAAHKIDELTGNPLELIQFCEQNVNTKVRGPFGKKEDYFNESDVAKINSYREEVNKLIYTENKLSLVVSKLVENSESIKDVVAKCFLSGYFEELIKSIFEEKRAEPIALALISLSNMEVEDKGGNIGVNLKENLYKVLEID